MTDKTQHGTGRRRLSVVIPCLNDADLLQRCLESVRNQEVPADEVVVVDNGCTDSSVSVAERAGAVVMEEPRRGITWATAAGFDAATGDLLVRVDADVVLAADYLRRVHETWELARQPGPREVVGITGDAHFEIPGIVGRAISAAYMGAFRTSVGAALGHHPLFGSNCSVDAQWWRRVRDNVDFSDTFVHDDIHLSFAVAPGETIWLQKDLVVSMDNRALKGLRQLAVRFRRGMHTIVRNWRDEPPYRRLAARGLRGITA